MTTPITKSSANPNKKEDSCKRTKCEVWTRVMGYHRPVSQYNKGKKSEFYSRIAFLEQISANSEFIKKYS